MAINLSNVNISLNEFQRLSIGEHNAGEVKLASENKLAKMNNHVGSFFVNKDIISHEEVIAIKQALVKALSQNGIGIAFHPEGKTGRINMNRNPDGGKVGMSFDFHFDKLYEFNPAPSAQPEEITVVFRTECKFWK